MSNAVRRSLRLATHCRRVVGANQIFAPHAQLRSTISPFAARQNRSFSPTCFVRQDGSGSSTVEPPEFLDEGERKVFQIVKDGLSPTKLEVQDVSGGCGSMYALEIVSEKFRGLSMIKQHRLVNSILKDEIKTWHGVRLNTKAP